jgi:NADP-dependent 3-hydroxy acid dehydrogenase YdfG
MDLEGQVAIVTGATSGIGRAVARALDAEGVALVLAGRRVERLEALAGELHRAAPVAGDVLDPAMPRRLVEVALERFGRLDIAFNNAGLLELGGIDEVDLERVATMVRVNVEAAFRFAYVVLRHFKAQDGGHLVNTSSVLGTKTRPTAGAYAGTKWAIEALAQSLRMELARTNVRISNVQPGLVLTEIHDHMEVHPHHGMRVEQPLAPEDIARAVMFQLCQPAHVRVPTIMVLPKDQEI